MGKSDIIVFVLIFAVVAFRLYQKYVKNSGKNPPAGTGKTTGQKSSSFPSGSTSDDYEPYSKR